jgi:hypothetical protein
MVLMKLILVYGTLGRDSSLVGPDLTGTWEVTNSDLRICCRAEGIKPRVKELARGTFVVRKDHNWPPPQTSEKAPASYNASRIGYGSGADPLRSQPEFPSQREPQAKR